MALKPLIDGGLFKYKWPLALEYTLFTIKLSDGEIIEVRGVRAKNKELALDPSAEVLDENHVREPESVLYRNLEIAFNEIFERCEDDKPIVFLGAKNNFREKLFPEYKKSRAGRPDPFYKPHVIDWMNENFTTVECDGYEEDDALAMSQDRGKTCIVAEDKDLLQIAGHNYNPVKKEMREISPKEGDFFLYTQILTGDSVDDIPGIKGVGPKTAGKLLDGAKSTKDLYQRALKAWDFDREAMHQTAQLVYLLRSEGDSYLKRKEVDAD